MCASENSTCYGDAFEPPCRAPSTREWRSEPAALSFQRIQPRNGTVGCKPHLTLRALPTKIAFLVRSRQAGWGLHCEPDPRGILSRVGEGASIGHEGQDNLGEVWRGQGLMHDRGRFRHFVDGYMQCDDAIIDSVVGKRPMIDPVVATSPSSHTEADRSLPLEIEQRRSEPIDVSHVFVSLLGGVQANTHMIETLPDVQGR